VTATEGPPATYECVECISNCDCGLNDYCSSQPGQVGTCQSFSPAGSSCVPLTQQQLIDSDYPSDWKCAVVYSSNQVFQLDQAGACIEKTCQYCDYLSFSAGFQSCAPGEGTAGEKYCQYPGKLVRGHTYYWTEGIYHEIPDFVWWAIFFPFVVIIMGIQIATLTINLWRRRKS